MGFFDLLSLVLENLGRRKARVLLTAVGVVIGAAAVVVLVSLAIGLQQSATQNLYGIGDLTQIQVMPNYGEVYVEAVSVGMKVGGGGGGGGGSTAPQPKLITDTSLQELAALPGVAAVVPRDWVMGGVRIEFNRLENYPSVIGVGTKDLSEMGVQAAEGSLTLERGTAIVGYTIPQGFWDPRMRPGQEPPGRQDMLDQQVRLVLLKYDEQGLEIRKSLQVKIVGVLQESRGESDYSMYLSLEDITAFNEWFMGKRINRNKDGYSMAIVIVDEVDQVLDITDQITALGYQAYTPQSFVEGINNFFLILQVIFGGVGAIALLVAAIGIANTMTMAILERTREIGLMKALGATNRDVLLVFLGEAAGIGLLGGVGGVLLGWASGQVINVLALSYLAGQAAQQGGPPPSAAVYTPVWLLAFSLIFSTLIGLLSGLYPALRAATLVPVQALKYE